MTKDLEKCWELYIGVKKGVFEERGLPVKKCREAGLSIHIDRKKENKGDLSE